MTTDGRIPFDPDKAPQAARPPEVPGPPAEPEWKPQPMVRWFSPLQLAHTGAQALLSSIFGTYADKREVQAALSHGHEQEPVHDYSRDDLWLDFTCDLGDGFDPTYSVAWMLSRERLPEPPPDASAEEFRDAAILRGTRRGQVLLLGGDQVYPTASREEYAQRFAGPYEAALPWVEESARPVMFAIPGNHDWYDGLTSFLRLFCQKRWIGGWQTQQTRSYFAMKLPGRWWLLGIDIQLGADVDKPQIDYFERVAQDIQPGDHVVLCTAQPAWVEAAEHPAAYDNLAFFEKKVLLPRGARLMLTLTGDLHHYARYTDEDGRRHKLTVGGGGAYLYGTHLLPRTLELPEAAAAQERLHGVDDPGPTTFERKHTYPDDRTSLRLRMRAPLLGLKNPGFIVFLGLVYSTYAWMLQSASRVHLDSGYLINWLATQGPADAGTVAVTVLQATLRSPLLAALAVFFPYAMYLFCAPDKGRPKWLRWFGLVHGAAHLVLILALTWLFAWFNAHVLGIAVQEVAAIVFFLEMLVVGGFLGALVFGLALLPGVNFNEAYSSQRIEHYKNFLRIHVAADGELTLYPIGIDRVARWERDPEAGPGEPYFRPRGAAPRARLIESPIVVPGPSPASTPPGQEEHA